MKAAKPSDWKTEPMPTNRCTIPLNRLFSQQEIQRIKAGLVPDVMEDKWFVFWKKDTLFFHRSWTGLCVYMVRFCIEGGSYRMFEADVNCDPKQYSGANGDHDAKMISYLIDVLLLHQEANFPSKETNSELNPIIEWSQVGRAMLGKHPKKE